jgi:hypothetical protein
MGVRPALDPCLIIVDLVSRFFRSVLLSNVTTHLYSDLWSARHNSKILLISLLVVQKECRYHDVSSPQRKIQYYPYLLGRSG